LLAYLRHTGSALQSSKEGTLWDIVIKLLVTAGFRHQLLSNQLDLTNQLQKILIGPITLKCAIRMRECSLCLAIKLSSLPGTTYFIKVPEKKSSLAGMSSSSSFRRDSPAVGSSPHPIRVTLQRNGKRVELGIQQVTIENLQRCFSFV